MENEALLKEIIRIHEASQGTYSGRKITHGINRKYEKTVKHKRIERIMRENGIRSKSHRKYKATTNSVHNLHMVENILNKDFMADRSGQKMVSDITVIRLYRAYMKRISKDEGVIDNELYERLVRKLILAIVKFKIEYEKA